MRTSKRAFDHRRLKGTWLVSRLTTGIWEHYPEVRVLHIHANFSVITESVSGKYLCWFCSESFSPEDLEKLSPEG